MPCVDAPNAACPHDIRITVAGDQTAVASGQLVRQTWAAAGRKTFHFSLPHATSAAHVAFAAGTPLPCSFCMSPVIATLAPMWSIIPFVEHRQYVLLACDSSRESWQSVLASLPAMQGRLQ